MGPQGVSMRVKGLNLPSVGVLYIATGGVLGMVHAGQYPGVYIVHHAVKREAFGHAVEPARRLLKWAWDEIMPALFMGYTPERNRLAVRFAERIGMRRIGRLDLGDETVLLTGWRDGY